MVNDLFDFPQSLNLCNDMQGIYYKYVPKASAHFLSVFGTDLGR